VTRTEPSRLLGQSRGRPDIAVLMPSGDVYTDVSITHVGYTDRAMEKRAAEKTLKYQALGAAFFPFVIGHTGELGKSAENFLRILLPDRAERDEARRELRQLLFEGALRLYTAARRG